MTRTQDQNMAIAAMIKLIAANNAGCVARKLREAGYPTGDKIPVSEIESNLFTIYTTNPNLFFDLMKKCDWNTGNMNWTNDPITKQQVINAIKQHTGNEVDEKTWWPTAINFLQIQYKTLR